MQIATLCELAIIPLVIYCAWLAYKQHEQALLLFLIFDAWLFEWVIILLLKDVTYSTNFHVQLYGIPLLVVFGWVILLYSCQSLFKTLNNIFLKAVLVAVILTTIDLIMDVVAVHFGLWKWKNTRGYFGIPYNNFFGWYSYTFLVSLSISIFYRSSKWMEYFKMLCFITIIGLTLGGLWYVLPVSVQPWVWWVIYSASLFYVFRNFKQVQIKIKNPVILLTGSFLSFSVAGLIFSFNLYPLFYILCSCLWLAILIYLSLRLNYRAKSYHYIDSYKLESKAI